MTYLDLKPSALLALIVLSLLFFGHAKAQQTPVGPEIVKGDANACELNSLLMDVMSNEARTNKERLFVVARLGRGETSRDLLRRRLHNVRTYLDDRIENNRLVYAEGEGVDGEGRVEFYMGSRLWLVSLNKRGRDICVTCCDFDDPRYYGFGKRNRPQRRRSARQ